MLNDLNYKESLKISRLKWNSADTPAKYGIFYILFLFSLLSFTALKVKYYDFGDNFGAYCIEILAAILIAFLIIFSLRAIIVNERLVEYPLVAEPRTVRKTIENYLKTQKYTIYRSNDNYLIAKNTFFFVGSSIVVIFNKKNIYINVQNQQGFKGYFPFSFGRNKKITRQLTEIVKQIQLNQPNLT